MKRDIILEILKNLKKKPQLAKKIKTLGIFVIVGFVITGALTIFAGISAFNYIAEKANAMTQSPVTLNTVKNFNTVLDAAPTFHAEKCWEEMQSLIALKPWIDRPALANILNLKMVCLQNRPIGCEGSKCETLENLINTNERRSI